MHLCLVASPSNCASIHANNSRANAVHKLQKWLKLPQPLAEPGSSGAYTHVPHTSELGLTGTWLKDANKVDPFSQALSFIS